MQVSKCPSNWEFIASYSYSLFLASSKVIFGKLSYCWRGEYERDIKNAIYELKHFSQQIKLGQHVSLSFQSYWKMATITLYSLLEILWELRFTILFIGSHTHKKTLIPRNGCGLLFPNNARNVPRTVENSTVRMFRSKTKHA